MDGKGNYISVILRNVSTGSESEYRAHHVLVNTDTGQIQVVLENDEIIIDLNCESYSVATPPAPIILGRNTNIVYDNGLPTEIIINYSSIKEK